MDWFVHDGQRGSGPITAEALRIMLATGVITPDTLVWRTGMETWTPASSVPRIGAPPTIPSAGGNTRFEGVATESSIDSGPVEVSGIRPGSRDDGARQHSLQDDEETSRSEQTTQLATPWRRYWARMLDVIIFTMLIGIVVGIVAPSASMPGGMFGTKGGEQLAGWISLPLALIIDGVVLGLFGGTPGKAIAGISVCGLRGEKPPVPAAIQRNIQMWWFGLGTGFPLIGLFTLIFSYRKVASGEQTRWELSTGMQSYARGGVTRTVVTAFVFILLMFGTLILGLHDF